LDEDDDVLKTVHVNQFKTNQNKPIKNDKSNQNFKQTAGSEIKHN